MELIADIGGSGSRWILLEQDQEEEFSLPGYHPLAKDHDNFVSEASKVFADRKGISKLTAYATGTDTAPERIIDTLRRVFAAAELELHNDLMAVARSLCGDGAGAAMILGTGMNFAWYDGQKLHHRMPCLGAILGDEGSGADLGKTLLHDAYYGVISQDEMQVLFPDGLPKLNETLDQIHHGNAANQFMASFTERMAGMEDKSFVKDLLERRFNALAQVVSRYFTSEERGQVHASGSVAMGFQNTLKRVFQQYGMEVVNVVKDPMPGLVQYHRQRQ